MAYVGNDLTVQQYAPQIAYFSGNASTTAFTLPQAVVSAAQILVVVANVPQNPSSAYTVSGTTLTFTSAPPTGTNNIWVEYTSLQTNTIAPSAGTVGTSQIQSGVTLTTPTITSGTLNSPTISGAVVSTMASSVLTSGTAVASTSGTSIDFTSIPSWVKRITIMFDVVSTNGTSLPAIQLGDSGGIETTGYNATSSLLGPTSMNTAVYTTSFTIKTDALATVTISGHVTLNLLSSSTNTWTAGGVLSTPTAGAYQVAFGGTKSLSATLDRVRITTVNGTDTFDAGSINILYE
jgi:hypothetical protein